MRKIKFRAWIEKVWEDEDCDEYEMCYDLAFEDFEPINDLLGRVENLMQFTGLKDKNGKEIYEGDIVKYKYHIRPDWDDDESFDEISEVKFWNGTFYPIPDEYECEDSYYSWKKDNFEVIGNIYENKELLK